MGSDENCGKCKKPVKTTDNGLTCETCGIWYHAGCEKVTQELYKILLKYEEQMWFCSLCRPEVKKGMERIKELEKTNEEMNEKLKDMEEKWEKFRFEIVHETIGKVKAEISADIVMQTTECVMRQIKEDQERIKRKENIIMYNVPESDKEDNEERIQEDHDKAKDLIDNSLHVKGYAMEKLVRLGKKMENRNRPLLIKLRNEREKWEIIKNAKNLKDERDVLKKKVGISLDLSEKEREHEKKLRNELKERREGGEQGLYIKNGKLLKVRREE